MLASVCRCWCKHDACVAAWFRCCQDPPPGKIPFVCIKVSPVRSPLLLGVPYTPGGVLRSSDRKIYAPRRSGRAIIWFEFISNMTIHEQRRCALLYFAGAFVILPEQIELFRQKKAFAALLCLIPCKNAKIGHFRPYSGQFLGVPASKNTSRAKRSFFKIGPRCVPPGVWVLRNGGISVARGKCFLKIGPRCDSMQNRNVAGVVYGVTLRRCSVVASLVARLAKGYTISRV